MSTPAILALLATIALGAVAGLHHLQRARRPAVVRTHLALALAATGLVAALALAAPEGERAGPADAAPPLLLLLALAAGWGAGRVWRRSAAAGQAMLVGHVFAGVAGFLVFLAWASKL